MLLSDSIKSIWSHRTLCSIMDCLINLETLLQTYATQRHRYYAGIAGNLALNAVIGWSDRWETPTAAYLWSTVIGCLSVEFVSGKPF